VGESPPARPVIPYRVSDFEAGRAFFRDTLGFEEAAANPSARWAHLRHGRTEVDLIEGEPAAEAAVAVIEVPDVKAEAERLRAAGVEVGVVLELHGHVRLLDVYDADGNRIQLTQDLE
jgi:catechol 2,3-dioxygenase-like lactoylglutathione lyase family enzyme